MVIANPTAAQSTAAASQRRRRGRCSTREAGLCVIHPPGAWHRHCRRPRLRDDGGAAVGRTVPSPARPAPAPGDHHGPPAPRRSGLAARRVLRAPARRAHPVLGTLPGPRGARARDARRRRRPRFPVSLRLGPALGSDGAGPRAGPPARPRPLRDPHRPEREPVLRLHRLLLERGPAPMGARAPGAAARPPHRGAGRLPRAARGGAFFTHVQSFAFLLLAGLVVIERGGARRPRPPRASAERLRLARCCCLGANGGARPAGVAAGAGGAGPVPALAVPEHHDAAGGGALLSVPRGSTGEVCGPARALDRLSRRDRRLLSGWHRRLAARSLGRRGRRGGPGGAGRNAHPRRDRADGRRPRLLLRAAGLDPGAMEHRAALRVDRRACCSPA